MKIKVHNRYLGFAAILTLFLSPVRAGDSLSLEECVQIAQARSPMILLTENGVQDAEIAVSESQAEILPQVRIKSALEYAPGFKRSGYDPALTNHGMVAGQLAVEQTLFDGGRPGIKRKISSLELQRSRLSRKLSGSDLRLETELAFIEVLRTREYVVLKSQSFEDVGRYLELVEKMQAGGRVGWTDVLKTRIQASEIQAIHGMAVADEAAAKMRLAEIMGISGDADLKVKGRLDSSLMPSPPDTLPGGDSTLAHYEVLGADLDLLMARSAWRPTVMLSADAGLLTSMDNLNAASDKRSSMLGASLALSMDMPLYSWGLNGFRFKRKIIARENALARLRLSVRGLKAEERRLRMYQTVAEKRAQDLGHTVEEARDHFLLTKSKFAGGSGTALEVLDALNLWSDTRSSLLQAQADLRSTSARLRRMGVR